MKVCLICGKEIPDNRTYCSRSCQVKAQHLNGRHSSPFKKKEIREKIKNTMRNKYGVDNVLKLKEIRELSQSENAKNKRINTYKQNMLKKHGVEWNSQLKETKEKIKKVLHSEESNIKREKTFKEKYNVNNYFETKEFKENRNKWEKENQLKIFETKKQNGTLSSSNAEEELRQYISSLGINNIKYKKKIDDMIIEIDILLPDYNFGIEYNGVYWHSAKLKSKNFHYNKKKLLENKGIDLIYVWEDQWINKKDLIKSIIKARLNIIDKSDKIYARQCEVREIKNNEYKNFCENNHIQGYRSAKIKLGLYYNNILVQTASFNKIRNLGKQNSDLEYEWIRGCPASLQYIVGGTSKLFKYFIKKYNPSSILCYADWNLFNGNSYKECGFEFDGYTGPDKFYIQPNTFQRINRNPYKYKEFKALVDENKLFECYGAGSLRFVWKAFNN